MRKPSYKVEELKRVLSYLAYFPGAMKYDVAIGEFIFFYFRNCSVKRQNEQLRTVTNRTGQFFPGAFGYGTVQA